jgi:solute:Na+ symporter, SSS family
VLTGILASRNRNTVKRNVAALPLYNFLLVVIVLLGYVAISANIAPVDGDSSTIIPALFDKLFPSWCAGLAFAAIGVGALVPAAIMAIAVANLFTRSVYRECIRPHASDAGETRVSKIASLAVKGGAVLAIILLNPQFAIDLQLISGVIIIQTLPPVAIGLFTAWLNRWALVAGLVSGLTTGLVLLYQTPQLNPTGKVVRAHFGGSAWPLSHLGLDTKQTVYIGLVALVVNLVVAVVGTFVAKAFGVTAGVDRTTPYDFVADEGEGIQRLSELVDGTSRHGAHAR